MDKSLVSCFLLDHGVYVLVIFLYCTAAEDADDGSNEAYHVGGGDAGLLLPRRATAVC